MVTEKSERRALIRFIHTNNDKEEIAGWKQKLRDLIQLFSVRSVVFTLSPLSVLF